MVTEYGEEMCPFTQEVMNPNLRANIGFFQVAESCDSQIITEL